MALTGSRIPTPVKFAGIPSLGNRIPTNQSAAPSTGHVSQLSRNRLGLLLYSFAPTLRSSQHPRRNQSKQSRSGPTSSLLDTSVWTATSRGEDKGGCCEPTPSWHRAEGPNLSCHSWPESHHCHINGANTMVGGMPFKKLTDKRRTNRDQYKGTRPW